MPERYWPDGQLKLACAEHLLHRLSVVPLHPPASYWPMPHTSHSLHLNTPLINSVQYVPGAQLVWAHVIRVVAGAAVVVAAGSNAQHERTHRQR